MKLSKYKLDAFFLGVFLVYVTIYNSSFKQMFTSNIWHYIVYAMYFVLYVIFIIQQVGRMQIFKQWLYLFFLSLVMLFYLVQGNLNVGIIFLLGLYTVNLMDIRLVLKVYLVSIVIAFLLVVGLSVLGVLPIHEAQYGMLVMGFRNPNTTGFYGACILVMHWVLNWRRLSVVNWLEVPAVVILLLLLDDFTALILVATVVLMKIAYPIVERLFHFRVMRYLIILMPILFFCMCLWIGHNFYNYGFLLKLNDIFTSRPSIWNYYLANYHLNLLGNKLPDVVLTGVNWTVGRGAFDGEFIFFPIINGLIAFVMAMGILMLALRKLLDNKQYSYLILFIVYIISAISENQLFIPYQCPVAVLMILICYPNYSFERKKDDIKKENHDCDRSDGRSRWGRNRNCQLY